MEIKEVAIVGRGAVGTVFGNQIHKIIGKEHFCFIVDEERKNNYQKNFYFCNDKPTDFHYVVTPQECNPLDLILICVKYPALKETIQLIRPFIKESTIIVSLLNGVTSEQIIMDTIAKGIVLHGIAQKMDAVKTKGKTLYSQMGEIVIGTPDLDKNDAVADVCTFFERAGISYRQSKDIIHDQWSKLMFNCGINQVCASYNVGYGQCKKQGKYHGLFVAAMKEVQQVAFKEGIVIKDEEVEQWIKANEHFSDDAMPSMRQDVLAQRYTEVDLFSKTMLELAKLHHIKVPVNAALYEKIKQIEANYKLM